jgi:hypothetical protein
VVDSHKNEKEKVLYLVNDSFQTNEPIKSESDPSFKARRRNTLPLPRTDHQFVCYHYDILSEMILIRFFSLDGR